MLVVAVFVIDQVKADPCEIFMIQVESRCETLSTSQQDQSNLEWNLMTMHLELLRGILQILLLKLFM